MWFVRVSYYKIANHTVPCGAVHCYLRYDTIIPFCGRFWYDFCSLVNIANYRCIRCIKISPARVSSKFFFFFFSWIFDDRQVKTL